MRSSVVSLALLCCVTLSVAACLTPLGMSAGPVGAPPPPGLERFYSQKLSWGSCEPFVSDDPDTQNYLNPRFECAWLEVPLDYADPGGRTARLGVLRQPALDESARIGSLVVNPGGPGASGMEAVTTLAGPGVGNGPIAQRFDIVGFDPRGVGASTPAIDCLTDAEREAERADLDVDPSPEGVAETEAENQLFVQRCVERVGVDVLANVGTRDVARDLDILRAALGDAQLTYLGYSYGTRLGAAYAEAFPDNVRAMVLDGAVDPTQSPAEQLIAQGRGFQQAFDAFARWCTQQPIACPLGQDPTRATEAFQALTRPLIDRPVPVGTRQLSYNDAITGTVQALYLAEAWPLLRQGLANLAQGNGEILLALADLYEDRTPDGRYSNTLEAFTAVHCVDNPRITDRAEVTELLRRFYEVSPFQDPGRGIVAARDVCALWPVPPTSEPRIPQVEGLAPVLVISSTGDPATPYQAGVDLARALGGVLLTVEANQHTVALQGNRCVDDVVTAYLVDLQLPDESARCQAA